MPIASQSIFNEEYNFFCNLLPHSLWFEFAIKKRIVQFEYYNTQFKSKIYQGNYSYSFFGANGDCSATENRVILKQEYLHSHVDLIEGLLKRKIHNEDFFQCYGFILHECGKQCVIAPNFNHRRCTITRIRFWTDQRDTDDCQPIGIDFLDWINIFGFFRGFKINHD